MPNRYLVISKEILPEIYVKVVEADEMIRTGKARGISDAVKQVGISRSTYYKYHEHVFRLSEAKRGKKVTITFLLMHQVGLLSYVLDSIARQGGNVLTIHQDIPINEFANVSITFDMTNLRGELADFIDELKEVDGITRLELIALGY